VTGKRKKSFVASASDLAALAQAALANDALADADLAAEKAPEYGG
jgi:hypothetical protein